MREIEVMKKRAILKMPKELVETMYIRVGQTSEDYLRSLVTVEAQLLLELEKFQETLTLEFTHKLPKTWVDKVKMEKGLPYNTEEVSFTRMFEVEYKNIFPSAPKGSVFESEQLS